MQQYKWKQVLVFSVLTVLLINVFHALFLYQKKWEPITVSFTVTSDFNTGVWTVIKPKYNDSLLAIDRVPLAPNESKTITTTITEPNGVQFFSFYWNQGSDGSVAITNISMESKGKKRLLEDIDKFVRYSSTNVTPVISGTTISASSSINANGWLMLNTDSLEKMAKQKQFKPLGWLANTLLLCALIIFAVFRLSKILDWFKTLKPTGSILYKIRVYLLYAWMVLLPFWLMISHILLAVSVALLLLHFYSERERFKLGELKNFIPLLLLFLGILCVSILAHPSEIGMAVADYSYFLLAPLVFFGIEQAGLTNIFRVFQAAVSTYLILLSIAIIERYLDIPWEYPFNSFFFESVELYWHSSYLAGFVLVALFFEFQRKMPTVILISLSLGALLFLYLSEARLPLFIGLILIILQTLGHLPKQQKIMSIVLAGILLFAGSLYVASSTQAQRSLKNTVLVNDTQKIDARPELWREAFAVSKENLGFGIGATNVRQKLADRLGEESDIKYRRYNAHNQYIEYLLAYGWGIPVLLILVLMTPVFFRYWRSVQFIIYFSLAMLVESYFSRQSGVVFFSLFYCFFIFYDYKSKQHIQVSSQ